MLAALEDGHMGQVWTETVEQKSPLVPKQPVGLGYLCSVAPADLVRLSALVVPVFRRSRGPGS